MRRGRSELVAGRLQPARRQEKRQQCDVPLLAAIRRFAWSTRQRWSRTHRDKRRTAWTLVLLVSNRLYRQAVACEISAVPSRGESHRRTLWLCAAGCTFSSLGSLHGWNKLALPPQSTQAASTMGLQDACQVDFVATLEGAPDLQLTVHGKEVRMCRARARVGQCRSLEPFTPGGASLPRRRCDR